MLEIGWLLIYKFKNIIYEKLSIKIDSFFYELSQIDANKIAKVRKITIDNPVQKNLCTKTRLTKYKTRRISVIRSAPMQNNNYNLSTKYIFFDHFKITITHRTSTK
jgi:hypothetical protein